MAINAHVCSYCNLVTGTVPMGISGGLSQKIFKESKYAKTQSEMIEKWDRPTVYLCMRCILLHVPGATLGKYKATSSKTQIKAPRTTIFLFYKDKQPVRKDAVWSNDNKRFELWLDAGAYEFIRIDAQVKRSRAKKDRSTPLFGDLSGGMDAFANNQGHRGK